MNEITITSDYLLAGVPVNTINLGLDANGFTLKRRFLPNTLQVDTVNKTVSIQYEEWRELNGKAFRELYTVKNYLITNRLATELIPQDLRFDQYVGMIASILVPAIAESLEVIPHNASSGYVLNGDNQ